jgi:hypothetical protein
MLSTSTPRLDNKSNMAEASEEENEELEEEEDDDDTNALANAK